TYWPAAKAKRPPSAGAMRTMRMSRPSDSIARTRKGRVSGGGWVIGETAGGRRTGPAPGHSTGKRATESVEWGIRQGAPHRHDCPERHDVRRRTPSARGDAEADRDPRWRDGHHDPALQAHRVRFPRRALRRPPEGPARGQRAAVAHPARRDPVDPRAI